MGRRALRGGPREPGPARPYLDCIVRAFMDGYVAATIEYGGTSLSTALDRTTSSLRGFSYEGAAMALTMLDLLMPLREPRLRAFVAGRGSRHLYMAYVGAGWAAARLRRRPEALMAGCDPLLGWLVVDGFGFHEGYFRSDVYIRKQAPVSMVSGYAARVFDQGLGRSLWFVDGANVERITRTVDGFAASRRCDLWSGVALAAAYAGGSDVGRLEWIAARAANYAPQLAQGAAFAAEARMRAGNMAPHTEVACRILAGVNAADAALVVRELRASSSDSGGTPGYEQWRARIGATLSGVTQAA